VVIGRGAVCEGDGTDLASTAISWEFSVSRLRYY
jgi:hypothetical protein